MVMQLSPHFGLAELIQSQIAVRRGIDNTPNADQRDNLKHLAAKLEEVREFLGHSLIITSAFRSERINYLVGGSRMSAHLDGLAADFICPAYGTPRDVAFAISQSPVEFDQLIAEGTWVHLSIDGKMRREVLTAQFKNGRAVYTRGIA